MRKLVDAYPGDRLILGEVYLLSTRLVAEYYGAGDELHLAFNFPPLYTPWDAGLWRRRVARTHELIDDRGAWATWVLSNHDNVRHRTRYGTEERARAALFLLLGLRGSPVLYAGEEIGLEDAYVPPRAGRRSRWTRRVPGPDPVDRCARPRLGRHRRLAALAARCPPAQRRRPGRRRRRRSSTSTGGCSPPADVARR